MGKLMTAINRWASLGLEYHRETMARRAILRGLLRKIKVGSHAQPALTQRQRKSRAKTNRRNARFAHTEILRANGYKGPNISRSRLIKRLNALVHLGTLKGRMVSRAPSVQNIPRRDGDTYDSVSPIPAPPTT